MSILNQSLKDIKIICINDGSTDNTGKILEYYAKTDSRIILINKKKLQWELVQLEQKD